MKRILLPLLLALSAAAAEYPGSIRNIGGTPVLHIEEKAVYASALRWIIHFGTLDELFHVDDFGPAKQFGAAKVPVIFLDIDAGWQGPDAYDYREIDRAVDKARRDYPEAWLIPSIHLEYTRWYAARHPEEAFTVLENGTPKQRGGSIVASFHSARFEAEAKEALTRLINHFAARGDTRRIIGYQINYGATAEWRYWDQRQNLPDHNPQSLAAWRRFAAERYGTVEQANAAWGSGFESFDAVMPPAGSFRSVYRAGYLRDPAQDRQVFDYERFASDSIARLMKSFTSHVKELTGGRALVGVYNYIKFPQLADCPSIDFGVSSTFYIDRAANGTALSQALGLEAMRRDGKIYWHDADMRTYLWPDERYGVARNVYESVMMMRREFLAMLINGAGHSWFNLHPNRNVYDNPVLMRTVAELESCAAAALDDPAGNLASRAEIAVVYDRLSSPAFWGNATMYNNYTRLGAAVDFFPSDRLALVDPAQYKLIVMVSCPLLTEDALARLEQLKGGGRTILFLYANGLETPDGLKLEAAEAVSAFRFKRLPGLDRVLRVAPVFRQTYGGEIPALGKATGPGAAFRLTVAPGPGDEVIGTAPDGEALFVRRRHRDWTAFYFHNYQTHPHILRAIARQAGVTVNYPYDDSFFQRNRRLILVNGGGGKRLLRLNDRVPAVLDLFHDRLLPVREGSVELAMLPHETRLLVADTPERLEAFRRRYREELARRPTPKRPEEFEFEILPADRVHHLQSGTPRQFDLRLRANRPFAGGEITPELPEQWEAPAIPVPPLLSYEVARLVLPITAAVPDREGELTLRLTDRTGETAAMRQLSLASHDFFYLSDLPYADGATGWGIIGRDRACTGRVLQVEARQFAKGFGLHAPGELRFQLGGRYRRLTGLVGVDRAAGTGRTGVASCDFRILGDDRELYRSGPKFGGEAAAAFEIDLEGVDELKLIAGDAGDGKHADHADFCDLKLYR